ncbi:leucine-rich repeat domain-containing protein [Candidatus Palauibacter sp.]|uniref:leucine-rich repeat domain-containing protein n=1 Tax=Candidatus Palauibacter sp. TaxID=3101350 RepID=UPI003B5B0C00
MESTEGRSERGTPPVYWLFAALSLLAPALLLSCADSPTEPTPPRRAPPDRPRPTLILVSPASVTLSALDDTVRLTGAVQDQNQQPILGKIITWTSSDESIVTVTPSGLVRSVRNGEATITGSVGPSASGTATIKVLQVASRVSVSPGAETLVTNDSIRLNAAALDANGHPVVSAVDVAWSSSDAPVATVDTSGLVTTASPGQTVIAATSNGVTGHMELLVIAPAPTAISVRPQFAALATAGETIRLAADVRDQLGRGVDGAAVTWSSSDPSLASVDAAGLVHGVGQGIAHITAQAGNATETARIAVGAPDRAVLVQFHDATGGPNWSRNDNWLTDAPVAEWYGVRVNGQGRITHLSLRDNNIKGSIPPELRFLDDLRNLQLDDNSLIGPIPSELGGLTHLDTLSLSENRLSGTIPPEFGKLADLESMSLDRNLLSGTIPPQLSGLASLERMWLSSNRLSGAIPPEIGNMANLEWLALGDNELTGSIPPELGDLVNLVYLRLDQNQLAGTIPPDLGRLARLTRLTLGQNRLAGRIPRELGNLANLETLALDGNRLTGAIPPEIGNMANLKALRLGGNQLTGKVPPELGNLTNLEALLLHYNELTGPLPGSLPAIEGLSTFWYHNNEDLCAPGTSDFVRWIGGVGGTRAAFCNESDAVVLASFFESVGGVDWTRSDGWSGGPALAEWYGVATDSLGRVVSLDLSGNGLVGRLPASLGELDQLAELWVGGNRLSGGLPLSLAHLPLRDFRYPDTGLCVPTDTAFAEWLTAIPRHEGTGEPCASLSDRDILAVLYEVTGGSNWLNHDNWLTEAPLGEWLGVEVDEEGHVVELWLRDNNLAGPIPPELGKLANLRVLRLNNNHLTGSIPPELGSLARLEDLALPYNQLTGPIPVELGNATALQGLEFTGNGITGSIPPELGSLTSLVKLRANGNRLAGALPPELGNLDSLQTLSLSSNRLTGAIPAEFGNLARLETILLSENRLTGAIPPELGNLGSLETMWLQINELTGRIPPELGNLTNLRWMELRKNKLTGSLPPELGKLRALEWLELGDNELTGIVPPELGRLFRLERVELQNNRLSGGIPKELGGGRRLKKVDISHNSGLAGPLPTELKAIPRLGVLRTTGTALCAPSDSDFLRWLAHVPERRVRQCSDGGLPAAYLTQVVQSKEFPVALVAGEPAFLRVFIATRRATSEGLPPVRATFFLSGSETYVAEIPARASPIPTELREGDLAASANSEIPGDVIRPGLEMVIEIDPERTLDGRVSMARRIPETGRLRVEVWDMPALNLTLIPFLWSEAPDSAIVEIVQAMAADPATHALLWDTRTLLPVDAVNVAAHEPVLSSSNNPFRLFDQTRAISILEGASGHYMGMISGSTITSVVGLGARPGRVSFAEPRGSTIAHELGHNFSLGHAPCGGVFSSSVDPDYPGARGSIGSWGYDLRDKNNPVPPSAPDLMSYCRPAWISEYHFSKALRTRLVYRAADATYAGTARSLLLWGGADGEGRPFLEPAFVVDAPRALPAAGGGAFALTGRSATGDVLFSLSFNMPEIADGEGRSSFAFMLPVEAGWGDELVSIAISGPGGTATLDGDTDQPMVILRDPRSKQVRGFLRDLPPSALAGGAAVADAVSPEPGLEALFSRGLPDSRAWRR